MNKGKLEHNQNLMKHYLKQAQKFTKERKWREAVEQYEIYAYFVSSLKTQEQINDNGEKRIAKNNGGIKNEKSKVNRGLIRIFENGGFIPLSCPCRCYTFQFA